MGLLKVRRQGSSYLRYCTTTLDSIITPSIAEIHTTETYHKLVELRPQSTSHQTKLDLG